MSQRMKKTLLFGSIGLFLLLTLFVALKLTTPIDTTFSKWMFQLHNPVFTAFLVSCFAGVLTVSGFES